MMTDGLAHFASYYQKQKSNAMRTYFKIIRTHRANNERKKTRLPRKCKETIPQSQQDDTIVMKNADHNEKISNDKGKNVLSDRVVCLGRQKKAHAIAMDSSFVLPVPVDGSEVRELVDDFNLLLGKCQGFIPVTRAIQKSVRVIVCQELTSLLAAAVSKNNLSSWMRLLAFPYLVLSSVNKSAGTGVNYIRTNLKVFKQVVDVKEALRQLLLNYGGIQYMK